MVAGLGIVLVGCAVEYPAFPDDCAVTEMRFEVRTAAPEHLHLMVAIDRGDLSDTAHERVASELVRSARIVASGDLDGDGRAEFGRPPRLTLGVAGSEPGCERVAMLGSVTFRPWSDSHADALAAFERALLGVPRCERNVVLDAALVAARSVEARPGERPAAWIVVQSARDVPAEVDGAAWSAAMLAADPATVVFDAAIPPEQIWSGYARWDAALSDPSGCTTPSGDMLAFPARLIEVARRAAEAGLWVSAGSICSEEIDWLANVACLPGGGAGTFLALPRPLVPDETGRVACFVIETMPEWAGDHACEDYADTGLDPVPAPLDATGRARCYARQLAVAPDGTVELGAGWWYGYDFDRDRYGLHLEAVTVLAGADLSISCVQTAAACAPP